MLKGFKIFPGVIKNLIIESTPFKIVIEICNLLVLKPTHWTYKFHYILFFSSFKIDMMSLVAIKSISKLKRKLKKVK